MRRWLTATALLLCATASASRTRSAPDIPPHGASYSLPGVKDAVTSIEIVYPLDGAVEKAPVAFKTQINLCVDQAEHFSEQYSGKYMCIETRDVNGAENTTTSCSQIGGAGVVVEHDTPGNFSVSAYIAANAQVASSSDKRSWQSNTVYFSVVSGVDFDAQISDQIRQEGKLYPYFNLSIIEWAVQQQHRQDEKLLQRLAQDLNRFDVSMTLQPQGNGEDPILVIGIKTAVVTNFAIRQAIRQTWASKEALPAGVKVFFLGCRPFGKVGDSDLNTLDDEGADLRRLWGAIHLEKLVYGDLLTDELDCDDSYADLPGKIKEFLHFTATKYAQAQYVMIADDDVYVRVDRVVQQLITKTPTLRFYSGQVRAIDNAQKAKVIRRNDGKYRYSLSKEEYPMSDLPPFALGAYFFLSMDCVEFVSKNRKRLMNMAGMDDMSVTLWMLVIQVHAQPFDHEPKSLLSASESNPGMLEKLKFCAYLYARCDSSRELMYDLLNALRPVDALGTCAGSSRPPDSTKMASRVAMFYNDDAVRRYAPYKFVIAFENACAPGYVTEKMVNAFLAGSVPVYLGDSTSVSQLFNPASFIDCGLFDSLQKCAEFVIYVDDSPELYTRMRQERPVTNMTAYYQAFSWHPAVSSRFMADAVLQYLVPSLVNFDLTANFLAVADKEYLNM
ncbi:hypothetical protein PC110_g12489 [Phytophthora cactorum]|uniref:Fucosyltransferase n=1 Tax=Phytophthora cactorum TaxID=29920 RepID=A0A329S370_9STRA|nr:hypothetical protein PC110_g12489 [Phytophthora cactorum]